jgi:hypothetical protein
VEDIISGLKDKLDIPEKLDAYTYIERKKNEEI